jgi:hypothetical protein
VDAANKAGGTDNITIVAARFRDAKEQAEFAEEEAVSAETEEDSDSPSNVEPISAT